jgi:hypothetical protein
MCLCESVAVEVTREVRLRPLCIRLTNVSSKSGSTAICLGPLVSHESVSRSADFVAPAPRTMKRVAVADADFIDPIRHKQTHRTVHRHGSPPQPILAAVLRRGHTTATLLLTQGVHPRVVMEALGHSQISLTLDTYSHVIPGLQADAALRMQDALGIGSQNDSQDANASSAQVEELKDSGKKVVSRLGIDPV